MAAQNASAICTTAAGLVSGERQRTHGPKIDNHRNIADLWVAYLGARPGNTIGPLDVALMMALLKIARTKIGAHNPDNYVDLAGYAGVAGEIAAILDNNT